MSDTGLWPCFVCPVGARHQRVRQALRRCHGPLVKPESIARYRKLASELTNDAERLQILKLLTEEEAQFKLEFKAAPALVPAPKSALFS